MDALLVIDYTNDFVHDQGKLTCGKIAQNLEPYITELTKTFINEGHYVAFPTDTHHLNDLYHPETKLFPPHNIKGTWGQAFYGALNDIYEMNKDNAHVYYFEKTRYSAFQGTDLNLRLRERGIKRIHLVGVCTDICILHTAIDAYNMGYDIVIHKDGVQSFDQEGHEWALRHFEHCLGAEVVE